MNLQQKITIQLKEAMKTKNKVALESLRAIKSAVLIHQTQSGEKANLTEEEEIKLLQKLVKQRKDSARIFRDQGREDLAEPEEAQIEVIAAFLPQQLDEAEIEKIVMGIITQTGATGMKDMGKVMGMATKQLAGKADGKTISTIVKSKLV